MRALHNGLAALEGHRRLEDREVYAEALVIRPVALSLQFHLA